MSRVYVIIKEHCGDSEVCAVTTDEEKAKKLVKYFTLSMNDSVWYQPFYPDWEYEGLDDLTPIWRVQWSDGRKAHRCIEDGWHHGPCTFENDFHESVFSTGKSAFIGRIAATKEEAIDIYEKEWERREQLRMAYEQKRKKHLFVYDEIIPGLQIQSGVKEIKEG